MEQSIDGSDFASHAGDLIDVHTSLNTDGDATKPTPILVRLIERIRRWTCDWKRFI
jgi:hypothetical protein